MPDPKMFPIMVNATERVIEEHGYLTDVITSYAEAEQRVQLRALPIGSVEFSILSDAREAQLFASIVYGGQDDQIGVPLWHLGSRLTGAVAIGANLLPIADALLVPYVPGGWAIAWADAFTWELFQVSGVGGGGVSTSDTAARIWPVGTIIAPVRVARLASSVERSALTGKLIEARMQFEFDDGGVAAVGAPTVYAGFDVLDNIAQDRGEPVPEATERAIYLLDGGVGLTTADAPGIARAMPVMTWKAFSRTEAAALRTFLDARKGRAVPFWYPSGQYDLSLTAAAVAGAVNLIVAECRFTSEVFSAGPGRRRIAIVANGVTIYRKLTNSVDNGNGTETITVDAGIPSNLSVAGTRISSLRLYRLENDRVPLEWFSSSICEARVPLRELTKEVPA